MSAMFHYQVIANHFVVKEAIMWSHFIGNLHKTAMKYESSRNTIRG